MEQLSNLLLKLNDHLVQINSIVYQMNNIISKMNIQTEDINSQFSQMSTMINKLHKNNYNLTYGVNTFKQTLHNPLELEMRTYDFLFTTNLGEKQIITATGDAEIQDVLEEYLKRYCGTKKTPSFILDSKIVTLEDKRLVKNVAKNDEIATRIIVYY